MIQESASRYHIFHIRVGARSVCATHREEEKQRRTSQKYSWSDGHMQWGRFPEYPCFQALITLPMTSCSVERVFSSVNRIKTAKHHAYNSPYVPLSVDIWERAYSNSRLRLNHWHFQEQTPPITPVNELIQFLLMLSLLPMPIYFHVWQSFKPACWRKTTQLLFWCSALKDIVSLPDQLKSSEMLCFLNAAK